jgi:uncharacterized integral membrane protein
MNLKRDGILGRWYHWNFFEYPTNFCPFFWKTLISIALLPLTWISVFDKSAYNYKERLRDGFLFYLITLVVLMLLIMFGVIIVPAIYYHPWQFLTIVGVLAGVVVAILLAVAAITGFKHSELRYEIAEVIATKKDSVMNKYCPKINWK